jgi:hypothetical protein
MKWKRETDRQRRERINKWHLVFAWKPKEIGDGEWAWLEFVAQKWTPDDRIRVWYVYGPRTLALTPDAPIPERYYR